MKYTIFLFESATAAKSKWQLQHVFNDPAPDTVAHDGKLWQLTAEEGTNLSYILKQDTFAVIP